ncbi:MAG TPA: WecB/TagA/CpsF family glycosyltransferase [Candidatus Baltobacteraceae bacterium]|nr:WecB/TagA/CpsF family glycosyltransferase [Candidatus Baltobacteraceae bacterium]
MRRVARIVGIDVVDQKMDEAVAELQSIIRDRAACHSLFFVNANTLNFAVDDAAYARIINESDLVFGDGTGVRWAARLRGLRVQANLNGTDVVPALLAATPGLRVFLLGGGEGVNARAAAGVARQFDVEVVGRHHGWLDISEYGPVIELINAAAPDLLLVGFGNPGQEQWIARYRAALRVPLVAGTGGLFGFWAGTRVRASTVVRRAGMEWVEIMIREPHKTRRYLLGNPKFLYRMVRWLPADRSVGKQLAPNVA